MHPNQKTTQTPKPSGYDPATLLVQLMNELSLDVGPESQTIAITLNSYDTFAYIVTTFAVNGYEVRITTHTEPGSEFKNMSGVISDDGWFIRLIITGVRLTQGEIEAASASDESGGSDNRSSGEQEGSVPGHSVRGGIGEDSGKHSRPVRTRKKRNRANDGIRSIGEVRA